MLYILIRVCKGTKNFAFLNDAIFFQIFYIVRLLCTPHLKLIVDDKTKRFFAGDTFNIIISYGTRPDYALEKRQAQYSTTSYRGLCLNYLKKISQTWWFSVGSIL